MVLLRRVEVRASGAHGRGVFALERIARGECWWRFDEESCDAYTHDEVSGVCVFVCVCLCVCVCA